MSRKKRMQDLREAKDRRMKKIAIGGGVLLVAVLAFEMSHMLGGHKSAAPAPTTTATTAATSAPTSAAPTATPTTAPGTATAALPTTGSTKLPNSDVAPNRSKSELDSFSDFAGKDPFAQQISSSSQLSTPTTGSSATPAASGSSPTPAAASPSTTMQTAKVSGGSAKQGSARTLAKFGAATISVNGRSELVRIGANFPSSNPLFHLVSITHGVARIGIASGSYTSGAHTVSLVTGRSLTLVDTADGIRYKLRLLAS